MIIRRWLLVLSLVVLSCVHSAVSHSCFCTSRDHSPLYDDPGFELEVVTVPDRNTCFLGTKFTDGKRKFIALEKDAPNDCENIAFGNNSYQGPKNMDLKPQYYGKWEHFFEKGHDGRGKRFLENLPIAIFWTEWSSWSSCKTGACNMTGHITRSRSCTHGDADNMCAGSDKDTLECYISCDTNKTVGWSGWMQWNDCSNVNCLNKTTTRIRHCLDEQTCIGKGTEAKQCTQDLCAVDGGWTDWTTWTLCSKPLGGITNRLRSCTNPKPSHGGAECLGKYWQIKPCSTNSQWNDWQPWEDCRITASNIYIQFRNRSCSSEERVGDDESSCIESERLGYRICQHFGTWGSWGSWSVCSTTQNDGMKTRSRNCSTETAMVPTCEGNTTETINCKDDGVSVPSEWSEWTACDPPCDGSSYRNRSCDQPFPNNCSQINEVRPCTVDICNVDGNWAEWNEWSNCTLQQVRLRYRSCTNPAPRNDGTFCPGSAYGVSQCNEMSEWGNWEEWKQCVEVRGIYGARFRYRYCYVGTKDPNGCTKPGFGSEFESESCLLRGSWSDWSAWSGCSVTCESGVITRTRTCNNTAGMLDCEGQSKEDRVCSPSPHCPVDGGYSEWMEWSNCPVTCGPGALKRTRYCNNPTPAFGGKNCSELGASAEASFCNIPCPTDGNWGDWSSWSNCNGTCGQGVMSRDRKCSNPAPSHGGHYCEGSNTSSQNCSLPLCTVDGGWSLWSNWSQCSCEKNHTRHRDCNNPLPEGNGRYCDGKATEVAKCEPNPLLACPINGGWSEWFEWSSRCSVTCGQGVVKRYRQCSNPLPLHGGEYCKGALNEQKPCIEPECPRDGVWATWSVWNSCSVTCGNGTQTRDRQCDPPPMYGGANCSGNFQEHQTCVQNPCPINGGWSDWMAWSSWDVTCSFATRQRTRNCDNPPPQYNGHLCTGDVTDTDSTVLIHCPVDGMWGAWNSWSKCSVTCENGTKTRSRVCDNPAPDYNGLNCSGSDTDTAICSDRPSCVVDGNWAAWTDWFGCTVTCGNGTNSRYRTCTNPRPQNGGKTCSGGFSETHKCSLTQCPIDGSWTTWGKWRDCSVTCGNGTQTRSRSCSNPIPKFGGKTCPGMINEDITCQMGPCPIDGAWSNWGPWSACGETCGNATKTRTRLCNNPQPQYNGLYCLGHEREEQICNLPHCPVNGSYGMWQTWEACSVTCGDGTRLRHRLCDSPAPQYGGYPCAGVNSSSEACNDRNCPIDGGWGSWTPWSNCKGTCDSAIHQRARDCVNPKPNYGGAYCSGDPLEAQPCVPDGCQTTTPISSTMASTTPSTTTQAPTTPSTSTKPSTTTAPTTLSTVTNASSNFKCYTCDGPLPEFCLDMMKPITCPEPYCINELTNSVNGEKLIDRRCGTKSECDKDWWTTTSDNDKCTMYDDTQTVTNYIHCTFCCTDELCNRPTVPTSDSLYKPNI